MVSLPSRSAIRPFLEPTTISPLHSGDAHASVQLAYIDDPVPIGEGVPGTGGYNTGGDRSPLSIDAFRLPPPPPAPTTRPQEKPAPPAVLQPVHVSQGVQAAKLVRQVKPSYPPLARQARIAGSVRLVAIIGRDGSIQNLQVASGHPLLTPAAVDAVKQWLYQPTLLNGQPVEVITQIDVNFTLSS